MHGKQVIKLGGETRLLSFNNYCLSHLGECLECDPLLCDVKVNELASKYPIRALTFIIYSGLMGEFEATANYKHGVSLATVAEWVGEADIDEFGTIWETFKEIMSIPTATQAQVANYVKKLDNSLKKKIAKKS
jgi:hypothetical protein